jgi:type VI secretion system secreted protein VgrG
MVLKQATRSLKVRTPLGEDVLLLTGFSGEEAVSQLFRFELTLISDDNAIPMGDIVGLGVSFSVTMTDGSPRWFHGVVNQFGCGGELEGRRSYRAEVVPWLWFLSQTTDCRIFQNKTVPQIIEQIFADLGFQDFETNLQLEHPTWEYCVQYRETDLEFVSRLIEEEGIFYYFRHEEGKHTLVLADHTGAYFDCQENSVDFPSNVGQRALTDHITSWVHEYSFRSGKCAQTDYNFQTPSTSLMSQSKTVLKLKNMDKFEQYDYPGRFIDKSRGTALLKLRMEEVEAAHNTVRGESQCKSFTPGGRFTIGVHQSSDEEGKAYVITSIRHEAHEPMGYETGAESGLDYGNRFTCLPEEVVARPSRRSAKPIVHGVQTAVVVGPPGEEIYPDKYGRVKVQFHWDREGQQDENSSCWVRVSQTHAGPGFGAINIPRIGEEVIVSFLEGDPDRPIITGRVYHE